ncbi:MAG: glycosyltransferase family 1 protein [Candidatus Sumerlaeales bacterium]|nr:glycosyltransferase family 1 protein [Candidatus Sumerlaeales bacterium]
MCAKKCRILVDARVIKANSTGVGVFVLEVVRALENVDKFELVYLTECPDYLRSVLGKNVDLYDAPGMERHPGSEIWLNTKVKSIVKRERIDVYWGPAFLIPWVDIGCPKIVTIHDLTIITYPEEYSRAFVALMSWYIRLSTRSSTAITVPSNSVRASIKSLFPLVYDKCRVVSCGVSGDFANTNSGETLPFALPERYLFALGDGFPRKNIELVRQAFDLIRENTDLSLVTVDNKVNKMIVNDRVVKLPHLKHQQLAQIYKSARMLVFPSTEEGFGIPVIEALACRCPVLLSDIDVLREVSGNIAQYFDPKNKKELAEKIVKLDCDENMRQTMIEKGLSIVKEFSWENSAIQLGNVIEELLNDKEKA